MLRKFLYSRTRSFRYAFEGWKYVLRTQPNAWVHSVVGLVVIVLCAWLRLPPRDWAIIVFAIALVWVAELFNTAMEAIIDLVSPDSHPLAKAGKDAAAGAVLVAALGAILIGLLIMGPPFLGKIKALLP
jgi:diacylglycerol kinase